MAQGSPNFAINPNIGVALVQIGDSSRLNPHAPSLVMTAGSSGSRIERVLIEAVGPTVKSIVRLWKYDGTTYHLWLEIAVNSQTPQAGSAIGAATLEAVTAPNLLPELLEAGWSLYATVNDTQVASDFNLQSICQTQNPGTAGLLTVNGTLTTAANPIAIAPLQTMTANTALTMTAAPYSTGNVFSPTLTSASNLSAINFLLAGRDAEGNILTETLAGPNNGTVRAVNVYDSLDMVVPLTTNAGTVSVGFAALAGSAVFPLESKVLLYSPTNNSGVNFTLIGVTTQGAKITETLAGPNAGYVQSANTYAALLSVSSSAAATFVSVGTPPILSGLKVHGVGGNF